MDEVDEKTPFKLCEYPEFNYGDIKSDCGEPVSEEPTPTDNALAIENERLKQELTLKIKTLEEHTQSVQQIAKELKIFQKQYIEEMIHDGVLLIQQITTKLTDNLLKTDDTILRRQIEKALSQIDISPSGCQIKVSPNDFETIQDIFKDEPLIDIQKDDALSQGGFVIKTQSNEIKMDIGRRLTELFDM